MGKLINIAGGVALGVSMSQFPEYSQQYVQRLGGAVDELYTVVRDFDNSAQEAGMSREEALTSLSGTEFLENRNQDMSRTIARHDRLSQNYANLREADAFSRLTQIHRLGDSQIIQGAWDDFQPAIPLSLESAILLVGGYVIGYGALAGSGTALRRRKKKELR